MIHRPIRYHLVRVLRQNSSPRQLAAGIAIGVFAGLAIPYGLQFVAIILLAIVFRHFNRIAALLGCSVTNPLTTPFIYLGYYRLGKWLTGWRVSEKVVDELGRKSLWDMCRNLDQHRDTLMAMGLAALIIASLCAFVTYFIARPLIAKYQQRRKKRLKAAFSKFLERAKHLAHVGGAAEPPSPPADNNHPGNPDQTPPA